MSPMPIQKISILTESERNVYFALVTNFDVRDKKYGLWYVYKLRKNELLFDKNIIMSITNRQLANVVGIENEEHRKVVMECLQQCC